MAHHFSRSDHSLRSRNRKLVVESLEQRYMLSADGLDLASLMPELPQRLNLMIMENLQQRAAQSGVRSTDLLRIPELRNPLDVSLDGRISPIDPLMVIDQLNRGGARPIADDMTHQLGQYDVSCDGNISPVDALRLIDALNSGQATRGPWWHVEGGASQIVADVLEHVQDELSAHGLDRVADHIDDITDEVTAYVDSVQQSVLTYLREHGYDESVDAILDDVRDARGLIHEHLAYAKDLIRQHIEYVEGELYSDLTLENEVTITREQIDALLDRRLSDDRGLPRHGEHDTVIWHVDYVEDLIDQHIDYLNQSLEVDQIGELIGGHVDYIVQLLDIHDVATPDLSHIGIILDHVQHVHTWLDNLGEGENVEAQYEHVDIPQTVQEHLDAVSDHVGYVLELIDQHLAHLQVDVQELVDAQLQFVRDLLDRLGL